ncbi:MAG TPA: DNA replication/repair protein RecF [Clostridiaceae bacterium]|nr:DNA replication/repair protein RecF [Clostridiaceae bacterium]
MYVKCLRLNNFRNYDNEEIEFSDSFNIIYGENAQGKTNILESIFICASGRSHRTNRDADLIKFGRQGYAVNLQVNRKDKETLIQVIYKKDGKKSVKINDIPVKKIGNLMGHLNVVMFSPEDLLIIKEGPSERRRFLDITISQLKPSYFYDLQQYAKIITQRNTLLKEIENKKGLLDTLEIWNNNIVKTGARIIKTRRNFVNKLSKIAEEKHRKITNGTENLRLKYACSFNIENCESTEEIEKEFEKALEKVYESELKRCTTLVGPQRDDCEILLNGMNIKLYGSQGQQRSAVLSMKLSEIDIMKEDTGESPILLLDDVMSELDSSRQEYLFESIKSIQTFITCTEKSFFEGKVPEKSSKFFRVKNGKIL